MQKMILVDGLNIPVVLARRKGTKHLKLAIKSDGTIRLTMPYGVSEEFALRFLQDKRDWITKHHSPVSVLNHGDRIGKSHTLYILPDENVTTVRTRLKTNAACVTIPAATRTTDTVVQAAARKVAEKALAKEADTLLPQRLHDLATKHRTRYKSVSTRKLKSRWGSCDSRGNIVLNIYLMQLDWHLIDYVIVHELAHLSHQHHQAAFWAEVERMMPDWKERRKELKSRRTDVLPTKL